MSTIRKFILCSVVFAFGLLMASFGEHRAQFDDPIPNLIMIIFFNALMIAVVLGIINLRVHIFRRVQKEKRVDAILKQLSDEDKVILKRELELMRSKHHDDFSHLEAMN